MTGLTSNFENPQYATPIGLIRYAQRVESERPARRLIGEATARDETIVQLALEWRY